MYRGKNILLRGAGTQFPLSRSLGKIHGALSHMTHSAFRKILSLDEVLVMQKFSIVPEFLEFLFPRR